MFYSENINLTTISPSQKPFELEIPIEQIKKGSKIILKNIFFDTDSFNIKSNSESELNKLILFMNSNISIKIEIGGHTDNKGKSVYNLNLSQKRAKSVNDFLIKKGLSLNRLKYKGFGDTVPISTNDTEEGRALNRRTELKIVE
jgi:outer membrane protein OmpA-like peptidoglycan-associated protein